MKYLKNLFKYLGIAVIALSLVFGVFVIDTPNHVHAAGDRFFIMGQVFVSSNTATITEVGRQTSTLTLNKTAGGAGSTFTIYRAQGITAVVTSGTTVITGSPVTLVGGSNTLTCDATNGTITLTLTIGTAANWNTVQAWAATSGGTGGAAIPTSAENALFDANSFTAASQVVTVDATAICLSMDWTGSTNSPRFKPGANVIYVYGNCTFINAMTVNGGSYATFILFNGSGTNLLTTNGTTISCSIGPAVGSTATMSLQDNLTCTGLYHGGGTILTNGKTITAEHYNIFGGTAARTLTPSSSTINITGNGANGWNTQTGLIITANTSTINIGGTAQFAGTGLTYNVINLIGTAHTITGNNTFATLGFTRVGVQTITFTDGSTQTVGNITRDVGVSIKTLQGSGVAGWNIAYNGATYISQDYFSISRSNATPAVNKFYAGTHSTNGGNNSGWNFYAPDVPTVTIQAQTTVNCFAVTGNGTITNLGAGNIAATMTGFRWGLATGIYPNDIQQAGAYPLGAFTEAISSLPYHTAVFMQAEALNSVGWGYSAELTFTTPFVGSPTNLTATINGNVIDLAWVAGFGSTTTMVIRGTSAYPTSIADGIVIYSGAAAVYTDSYIDIDVYKYYYSAFGITISNEVSPTYISAQAGGAAVTAIGNNVGMIAFLILTLGLTISSFALRKSVLALGAGASWMLLALYSMSQSSAANPSQITDIYMGLFWIGIIFVIVCVFEAVYMRPRHEDAEESHLSISDTERMENEYKEIYNETRIPAFRRRKRKTI
jgi:hypothetical protein